MIYDELIDEGSFVQLPFLQQTELISHYCGQIKEKINGAVTQADAQIIADEHCAEFQRKCSSAVLRNAMTHYVRDIIKHTWPK
jgi:hypothetical protein